MLHIAIIIPIYNQYEFLEAALSSAAGQDYAAKSIIVVDDGSDAPAAEKIQQISNAYAATYIRQDNTGPAGARHTGVVAADADYIVLLDADDMLQPGALTCFAKSLLKYPTAIGCYGSVRFMDSTGVAYGDVSPKNMELRSQKELLMGILENKPPFCVGAVCIKRDGAEVAKT
jgi:glycosyltransferase involved in cell wall biosynthesis